jgi:hypothetical protein
MKIGRAWTLLLGTLLVSPASAGILDSSPPQAEGGVATKVVFRMGPVYSDPGAVDTVITCTNNADQPNPLAVEVFDENDTRAGDVARRTAQPNETISFVTSEAAGVAGGVVIPALPTLDHGKARVSAESAKLSCTAMLRVRASDGSTKENPLELVKKVAFDD